VLCSLVSQSLSSALQRENMQRFWDDRAGTGGMQRSGLTPLPSPFLSTPSFPVSQPPLLSIFLSPTGLTHSLAQAVSEALCLPRRESQLNVNGGPAPLATTSPAPAPPLGDEVRWCLKLISLQILRVELPPSIEKSIENIQARSPLSQECPSFWPACVYVNVRARCAYACVCVCVCSVSVATTD